MAWRGYHRGHAAAAGRRARRWVALTDEDGVLVLVNRRLEEMFGYEHRELVGQPVETPIPADLEHAHRIHRAGYAQAPKARPMGVGARLVGLRKDGTSVNAHVRRGRSPGGRC